MATNQGNSEIENLGNLSPDNLILGQLGQENQALNNKVGVIELQMDAMRMQMAEILGILQTLKNGITVEATTVVNPNGTAATLHPSGTTGQVQPNLAANDTGAGTPQVQIQIPVPPTTSGTQVGFDSQPTVHPQAQGPVPQITIHPRNPHVAPAVVSMNNPHYGVNGRPSNYPEESRNQYQMLEERLKAVEGSGSQTRNAHELCLVPNLVLPPKFKPPVFDKYQGATCPHSHVRMYCRKMTAHARDDNLMIHCFQESLAGASLEWYMKLEPTHIRCWKDLADAFVRQYQYNSDLAPDRTQLQCMSKRDNESFKEYAQRWRALAAQVTPPLLDKELISMFMETLPPWFFERLVSSAASSFSDVVFIGERIENAMRSGKIAQGSAPPSQQEKSFSGSHKEGETNAITGQKKSPQYDPIPMSYTNLCGFLISHNLISPREMKPVQPPFPRGYDPQATCEFHAGAIGHSAENCYLLKHLVQGLIDSKRLTFEEGGEGLNPLSSGWSGRNGNS